MHLVHQADGQGFLRIDLGAGHRQPLGFGIAQAFNQEGGDLRGHDAQRGLRQAEAHVVARQAHVRDAGQTETAAHHGAFQHGDDGQAGVGVGQAQAPERSVDRFDRVALGDGFAGAQLRLLLRQLHAGLGHVADVATGAEMATGAPQHHDAHGGVGLGMFQGGQQLLHHGHGHGVAYLGAVQGEGANAPVQLDLKGGEAHEVTL